MIASLSVLASRLPQLLGQLDRWLTRGVEHGRIAVDAGEYAADPQAAAAVASHWLDTAHAHAGQLHRTLDQAQQAVAFMAANTEG